MARVTVEDCLKIVPNRFDLVLMAAHRSRELSEGHKALVPRDGDKNPVIALREIAEERIPLGTIRESLVRAFQKQLEDEEEIIDGTGKESSTNDVESSVKSIETNPAQDMMARAMSRAGAHFEDAPAPASALPKT